MRYRRLLFTCLLVVLAVPAGTAWADVPANMNVQGRLTDGTGAPVASGFKIFTFKIFDAESGGLEIWPAAAGETQTIYTDAEGLWNARIGEIAGLPASVFSPDTVRWLEITINDGVNPPETLPRIKLNTHPYSYRAAASQLADNAALLGGYSYSDFAQAIHGHAPADISPQGPGSNLDADRLDNRDASYFLDLGNITSGILAPSFFSAYADLTAEGYLDNSAANDILTRVQADNRFVEINGDVMTGGLESPSYQAGNSGNDGYFDLYRNGSASSIISGRPYSTHGASWLLRDELGSFTHVLEADGQGSGGYFSVHGAPGSGYFNVDGNNGTGSPTVTITGSSSTTTFITDISGNNSVQLPTNAIFHDEILDEPGIAANVSFPYVVLTQDDPMVDLLTRNITIPAAGYIVAIGVATVQTQGTTERNQAILQIDESAGGNETAPFYMTAGLGQHPSTSQYDYFPVTLVRVFSKSAGTYTIRLEAKPRPDNGAGAMTAILYSQLVLTYYPTSYGAVASVVSVNEAGQFDESEAVTVLPVEAGEVVTEPTKYRVDLRDLELKAARAEAAAERARRELAQARAAEGVPQSDAAPAREER